LRGEMWIEDQEIVVVESAEAVTNQCPLAARPLEASAKQMLIELEEELEPSGRDSEIH
jgi:hypothetical protein